MLPILNTRLSRQSSPILCFSRSSNKRQLLITQLQWTRHPSNKDSIRHGDKSGLTCWNHRRRCRWSDISRYRLDNYRHTTKASPSPLPNKFDRRATPQRLPHQSQHNHEHHRRRRRAHSRHASLDTPISAHTLQSQQSIHANGIA